MPQQPTLYENTENTRYSKEQLLEIYRIQKESGNTNGDVSHLLHPDFDPWQVNGTNGRASWGKSSDGRDTYGPNVCWDKQASNEPITLQPMTDEEKSVRNSPSPSCSSLLTASRLLQATLTPP